MKVVIDIAKLHPKALKRGSGIYALRLYNSLLGLKDKNQYFLRQTTESHEATIVHFPYFDPFFLTLPFIKEVPTVVTVHDLIPIRFIKHYPPGLRGKIKWFWQNLSLKGAAAVITDSESSKKDIIKFANIPENKIAVIYLAAGQNFKKLTKGKWQEQVRHKYNLPKRYLLYVGDINWNKNIPGLIKAFTKVKSQFPQFKLILVGSAYANNSLPEFQEIQQLINQYNLKDEVMFLDYVPENDLVVIYNLASLYVQPSFYEGFGLPVLEAMSCGCPVVSSNQSSLPEIGGQAVTYFDPHQEGDLAKKLILILSNPHKLRELSNNGLVQAKKFTWLKTAQETVKVYEKIS
jgi:glycosyltransferase involved in cell wall biosynthesis